MTQQKYPFRIYIDRLKGGESQTISETLDPAFLDMQPKEEIRALKPVVIEGSAYLVDEYLVLSLDIKAELEIYCSVCNEPFAFVVHLSHFLHEEQLSEIKKGVFDFSQVLRDTIFLEIPFYPQCGGKTCANRKKIEQFLKKDSQDLCKQEQEEYHPFKDLL